MEAGLPEEKGQGLEKGLEVVVVVYGILLNQLNVTKHLQQHRRCYRLCELFLTQ